MTDPQPSASSARQADSSGPAGEESRTGAPARKAGLAREQADGLRGHEPAEEDPARRPPAAGAGGEPAAEGPADGPLAEEAADGLHLTTLTHEGRFWDVFVEFVDAPGQINSHRARLCFVPGDRADRRRPARTAVIIIEPSADAALDHARSLTQHEIVAMLRSAT